MISGELSNALFDTCQMGTVTSTGNFLGASQRVEVTWNESKMIVRCNKVTVEVTANFPEYIGFVIQV